MRVTVIGCGRWGSFIAWYANTLGHRVTLYGRAGSARMEAFAATRSNGLVNLPGEISLCTDLPAAARDAECVIISVPSQALRGMLAQNRLALREKPLVLCMKGLEIGTGKRLTQIAADVMGADAPVAVWLGPGHVQEFVHGVPNCMVMDSADEDYKHAMVEAFSGELIRFYYGRDLLGNEVGAAAKNVVGIAAGMLDGLSLHTLKGALMSRGTREIARLVKAMGGNERSVYGLCHLGDYEATVFSAFSHNRRFGECFVTGQPYAELAEGYYTVEALLTLSRAFGVELPICEAVHRTLYEKMAPEEAIRQLFQRSLKDEW